MTNAKNVSDCKKIGTKSFAKKQTSKNLNP